MRIACIKIWTVGGKEMSYGGSKGWCFSMRVIYQGLLNADILAVVYATVASIEVFFYKSWERQSGDSEFQWHEPWRQPHLSSLCTWKIMGICSTFKIQSFCSNRYPILANFIRMWYGTCYHAIYHQSCESYLSQRPRLKYKPTWHVLWSPQPSGIFLFTHTLWVILSICI